jgi:hypothetical protein
MRQRQPEAEPAHQSQIPTGMSTPDTRQVRGRLDFVSCAFRYASTLRITTG